MSMLAATDILAVLLIALYFDGFPGNHIFSKRTKVTTFCVRVQLLRTVSRITRHFAEIDKKKSTELQSHMNPKA